MMFRTAQPILLKFLVSTQIMFQAHKHVRNQWDGDPLSILWILWTFIDLREFWETYQPKIITTLCCLQKGKQTTNNICCFKFSHVAAGWNIPVRINVFWRISPSLNHISERSTNMWRYQRMATTTRWTLKAKEIQLWSMQEHIVGEALDFSRTFLSWSLGSQDF